MERTEYLKNRFKRDFLRYSLLQEDSLSAKAIADKLYGVIELDWLTAEGKNEIEYLIDKHLSFEKVKIDGKISNELSDELDYEVKDMVLAEFTAFLDSRSTEEIANESYARIEKNVELQTWTNGIVNMQEAVRLFVARLNNSAKSYGNLSATPISDNELLEKFDKAKNNTIIERIKGNNIDDIIEYRSALIGYVRVSGENMLYDKLKNIYECLAGNDGFGQLQSNFLKLDELAHELKSSTVDCEADEECDKEYNRLVPVDFYYRNVENITPEHAFHMVLLQFFAKNEEWMAENGLLVNCQLKIYTHPGAEAVRQVVDKVCEI